MNEQSSTQHNVEAEQTVLGIVILNNEALQKCVGLMPNHFYDPVHQRIFDACVEGIGAGRLVSPVTLKHLFAGDVGLEELGGHKYLLNLAGSSPSQNTVGEFAKIVKDLWARRTLSEKLSLAQDRMADPKEDPHMVLSDMEADVAEISAASSDAPLVRSFITGMTQAVESISTAYRGGTGLAGVSSGLLKLDKATGGFAAGDMVVIAGRPGMGKTALGLNIAVKAAMQGTGVFFASLEMLSQQLAMRFFSQVQAELGNKTQYSRMRKGDVSEEEFKNIVLSAKSNEHLPLITAEPECRDVRALRMATRRAEQVFRRTDTPLGLVVIDYLQMMRVVDAKSQIERISKASNFCKALALDFGVPVIVMAQLNRGVESRDDKRPMLSDLRDSGEIEQDADTVIFPYREEYYLHLRKPDGTNIEKLADWEAEAAAAKNKMDLIIGKQRSGALSSPQIYCDLAFNFMADEPPQLDMGF